MYEVSIYGYREKEERGAAIILNEGGVMKLLLWWEKVECHEAYD